MICVIITLILILKYNVPQSAKMVENTVSLYARRGEKIEALVWKPIETAIIICDMWDTHTCRGAAKKVAEIAPKINGFVAAGRTRGMLIVHAPSDVINFYNGTSQRQLAQYAPMVKASIAFKWNPLDLAREGPLPIDDSDWCDCTPKCPIKEIEKRGWPWTRQIETITIAAQDAISANGQEIFNLFEHHRIKNIIMTGVHTNMCVLGRSFGIRQMVMLGKNVVIARDLTDGLYNHRQAPFVSHDEGVALVIGHIEKYWCPSILGSDLFAPVAETNKL